MTRLRDRLIQGFSFRTHVSIGVITLLVCVFFGTNGYLVGYYEQSLLSIHGISLADKTAFVGDWFNLHAPQPHIFFDVVTYVGERLQFLDGIYFLYYVASCFMFTIGTALLARHWLPHRLQWMQHLVNALAAVGPAFSLGTFLTIHTEAVPNMAGACAAYLGLSLLITRNWTQLALVLPLTSVLHLQHGIGLATIVLLAVIVNAVECKPRLVLASAAALLIAGYMVIERNLLGGSSEIANDVAVVGSTGHFNVETWGPTVIWSGLFLLGLSMANFALDTSTLIGRRICFVFGLTAFVPIAGVISDLWNIEPMQSLSRSFFVYRFSMYLVPFAYWLIVRAFARSFEGDVVRSTLYFTISAFFLWKVMHLVYSWVGTYFHARLFSLLIAFLLVAAIAQKYPSVVGRLSKVALGSALIGFLFVAATRVYGRDLPQLGLSRTDANIIRTAQVAQFLGPQDVVATDPSISWMRLFLRRAIVSDCHGAPYGGDAWWEYRRRLRALGVEKPNACVGFNSLTIRKIVDLRRSVGATTILLTPEASSFKEASERLQVRWRALDGSGWVLFDIPTVNSES